MNVLLGGEKNGDAAARESGAATGRIAVWAMVVLAGILLLPALFYSLQTGFALVDDMSDWQVVSGWCRNPQTFLDWCSSTFLRFESGRYRPMFELGNLLAWSVWGHHPAWHHAARWALKLMALVGFMVSLRWIMGRDRTPWPLLVAAYLFLFFPNQPDARLAPQELNTVVFLALLLVVVVRVQMVHASHLEAVRGRWLLGLYLACLGLSWSKETNVALLAWVSVWFVGWGCVHRSWRALWRVVPVLLLTLYTVLRVSAAAQGASYGVETLTWSFWQNNMAWLASNLFQTGVSLGVAAPLMLLVGAALLGLARRAVAPSGREWCELFVFGASAALLLIVSTSWLHVLRYWYPLVPLLALLVGFGLSRLLTQAARWGRWGRPLVEMGSFLFVIYFVICNLHATYAQYAVQEHARTIERAMMGDVERRLIEGQYLFNRVDEADPLWEFNRSLQIYFNDYLVQKNGFEPRLARVPPPPGTEGYLVSPVPMQGKVQGVCLYERTWPSAFMAATYKLSAAAQGRRPVITIDAGASKPLNFRWFLYQVQP